MFWKIVKLAARVYILRRSFRLWKLSNVKIFSARQLCKYSKNVICYKYKCKSTKILKLPYKYWSHYEVFPRIVELYIIKYRGIVTVRSFEELTTAMFTAVTGCYMRRSQSCYQTALRRGSLVAYIWPPLKCTVLCSHIVVGWTTKKGTCYMYMDYGCLTTVRLSFLLTP